MSLKEIEIPASVIVLDHECFGLSETLTRVSFASNSNLRQICLHAFYRCENLKEIEIPESVDEIGGGVFSGCNIPKLSIHAGNVHYKLHGPLLISSDHLSIVSCFKQISNVTIQASVKVICEFCFALSESLSRVVFESGSRLKHIMQSAYAGCTKLTAIKIPASVETISEHCFAHCTSLCSVTFERESCLRRIEEKAFSSCALTKIQIPKSVEIICEERFGNCESLQNVIFESGSQLEQMAGNAFSGCHKLINCDAPPGCHRY